MRFFHTKPLMSFFCLNLQQTIILMFPLFKKEENECENEIEKIMAYTGLSEKEIQSLN